MQYYDVQIWGKRFKTKEEYCEKEKVKIMDFCDVPVLLCTLPVKGENKDIVLFEASKLCYRYYIVFKNHKKYIDNECNVIKTLDFEVQKALTETLSIIPKMLLRYFKRYNLLRDGDVFYSLDFKTLNWYENELYCPYATHFAKE